MSRREPAERSGFDAPEPPAFIGIWPRGFSKSTLLELALIYLGSRGRNPRLRDVERSFPDWCREFFPDSVGMVSHGFLTPWSVYQLEFARWVEAVPGLRDYALYASDTQQQAEQHLDSISSLLTSPRYAQAYPQMADRQLTVFGTVRGWRRQRLWTADGFTVDAAGLDRGLRGIRRDNTRPRVICFDDVDRDTDSPTMTARKISNLTRSILPAQAPGCAFIGVQNLVVRGGIFSQLADGTADFLHRRKVSGPYPALAHFNPERDLAGRPDGGWDIVGGESTWDAMRRDVEIQRLLDDMGREAFLLECQHMLSVQSHLIFSQFSPDLHEYKFNALPEFTQFFGGLDFGGEGDDAHNSAVTILGLTRNFRLIMLDEWYGNGENVEERQEAAMLDFELKYGHVRWAMDADERTHFQTLRRRGFDVVMSSRRGLSAVQRRRRFGHRLSVDGSGRPGFYYVRKCVRFRHEVERWHRPPTLPGGIIHESPVPIDDDVLVSVLYATERCEMEQDTPFAADQPRIRIVV